MASDKDKLCKEYEYLLTSFRASYKSMMALPPNNRLVQHDELAAKLLKGIESVERRIDAIKKGT